MLTIWGKVTGRQTLYIQCSHAEFGEAWGIGGTELGDQLVFGEAVPAWEVGLDVLGMEALGIKKEDVVGLQGTLEGLKANGVPL
jgi:hypothetical protein